MASGLPLSVYDTAEICRHFSVLGAGVLISYLSAIAPDSIPSYDEKAKSLKYHLAAESLRDNVNYLYSKSSYKRINMFEIMYV